MPNTNCESVTVESELCEAMEQASEGLAVFMDGGEMTESVAHQALTAFDFAIQALRSTPDDSPAPMTQHRAMEDSVKAFSRERRDQAVSHARHCVDSVIGELNQVVIGDALTPERAFLLVVALESAGDNLEDLLEGLLD